MMFGEEVAGRFLARWPTFFKPRIVADFTNMASNEHVEELLSAHENSDRPGELVTFFSLNYFENIFY